MKVCAEASMSLWRMTKMMIKLAIYPQDPYNCRRKRMAKRAKSTLADGYSAEARGLGLHQCSVRDSGEPDSPSRRRRRPGCECCVDIRSCRLLATVCNRLPRTQSDRRFEIAQLIYREIRYDMPFLWRLVAAALNLDGVCLFCETIWF